MVGAFYSVNSIMQHLRFLFKGFKFLKKFMRLDVEKNIRRLFISKLPKLFTQSISVLGLLSQWELMRGTYKELQHQSWTD